MNLGQRQALLAGAAALSVTGVIGCMQSALAVTGVPIKDTHWIVVDDGASPTTPAHTYPPPGGQATCDTQLCRDAAALVKSWAAHPAPSPTSARRWTVLRGN
jgi:hypothetical protein